VDVGEQRDTQAIEDGRQRGQVQLLTTDAESVRLDDARPTRKRRPDEHQRCERAQHPRFVGVIGCLEEGVSTTATDVSRRETASEPSDHLRLRQLQRLRRRRVAEVGETPEVTQSPCRRSPRYAGKNSMVVTFRIFIPPPTCPPLPRPNTAILGNSSLNNQWFALAAPD
jgi:hypothetical protein